MALGVALLGSTGSIGRSALAVLARHPERFRLVALAAHRRVTELAAQVLRYRPEIAVLVDGESPGPEAEVPGTRWVRGEGALLEAATHPAVDVVINAVVGAAGLQATLAALQAGKRLALANKESLVAGGPLVLEARRQGGGMLVPVDSEHSAILQCLRGAGEREVRRLVLTASGGPFRNWEREALEEVTPDQALRHPTWEMGAKITVDSATLANKALEVIEAHFLFGLPYDRLGAVIHPQSIVHSLVEFVDGSVLAQAGFPTMELPILYALTHPDRIEDTGAPRFDPVAASPLTFEPLDEARFPAFRLGVEAGRAGGTAPAVFNAANEVAVASFLDGELPFVRIPEVIERVLAAHEPAPIDSLEVVLEADGRARAIARKVVAGRC
ncbi:MAG TPA: 1-deoxy-D-xylulose-5-phosphate reductoisomerase [Longimicrobiales bacterium]